MRRAQKTVLDGVSERLDADPDRYAEGLLTLIEKGDPRVLPLLERLYAASKPVEVPKTLEGLKALSRDERLALLDQIERKHGPTLTSCPHCSGPLLASLLPDHRDPAQEAGGEGDRLPG